MTQGSLAYHAPAKINLTLEVLARRDDGFHAIRSVMVPLDLADELVIEPSDRFAFVCDRADLSGDDNLAARAVRALGTIPPRRVELRKRIPVQAGLGGGSSDAGAVLRAAMDGAFGPRPTLDWLQAARTLGSDVPFFLARGGALVEGTGERVTPLGALPAWHVLVIKPPVSVSTAAAYAELDRRERPRRTRRTSVSIEMVTALQRGNFEDVIALMQNDFQETIAERAPAVANALGALRSAGASKALLAGSGSCVFALAESRTGIASILDRLSLTADYQRLATAFASTPDWRA
jgi:4-diphosphocytidyl-2-C-methyl-D-erythritol kinase